PDRVELCYGLGIFELGRFEIASPQSDFGGLDRVWIQQRAYIALRGRVEQSGALPQQEISALKGVVIAGVLCDLLESFFLFVQISHPDDFRRMQVLDVSGLGMILTPLPCSAAEIVDSELGAIQVLGHDIRRRRLVWERFIWRRGSRKASGSSLGRRQSIS